MAVVDQEPKPVLTDDAGELLDEEEFTIPELPSGNELCFVLVAPWDDPFYVGLSGIEIFTEKGTRAPIDSVSTNGITSFGDIDKIVRCPEPVGHKPKGWMCNYREIDPGPVKIRIKFNEPPQTIAMIRIWNYNESRVNALRGVRTMEIEFDGQHIFRGEICCSLDFFDSANPLGDTILFTTNEQILMMISVNDDLMQTAESSDSGLGEKSFRGFHLTEDNERLKESTLSDFIGMASIIKRPITGNEDMLCASPLMPITSNAVSFPFEYKSSKTRNTNETDVEEDSGNMLTKSSVVKSSSGESQKKAMAQSSTQQIIQMELAQNWGCPGAIGLTGVQFLGPGSNLISGEHCTVRCSPDRPEDELLLNLINGNNLTCDPDDMWLRGLEQNDPRPVLTFTFPEGIEIIGVSIWNYNATPELAYTGVHCVKLHVNGRAIPSSKDGTGIVLLRKAPGDVLFDYVQDVMFDRCYLYRPLSMRPKTNSLCAFIFELKLLQSWGDEFYIGLNGIELYNRRGQIIHLGLQNIAAFPESVNILPLVKTDPRTSDKLIDGVNETMKPYHMWLTPILPNTYARVFVIFDFPTFVSRIRIFNYRKTPERGVRQIAICADDLIIYSHDSFPISTSDTTGILDISLRDLYQ